MFWSKTIDIDGELLSPERLNTQVPMYVGETL